MDETILVIVICFVVEGYLTLAGIVLIFETYYYYKDGNKKGTNLKGRMLRKGIKHELVHARIANIFNFTDWKIIPKIDGLACKIDVDYDVMNWNLLFNFLMMCGFHFIFDVGGCVIQVNVISICDYIRKYFLDVKMVINKFIKK